MGFPTRSSPNVKYTMGLDIHSRYVIYAKLLANCYDGHYDSYMKECIESEVKRLQNQVCHTELKKSTEHCTKAMNNAIYTLCKWVPDTAYCHGRHVVLVTNSKPAPKPKPTPSTTTTTTTTTTTVLPTTAAPFPMGALLGGFLAGALFGVLAMLLIMCLCRKKSSDSDSIDPETGKKKKKKSKTGTGTGTSGTTGTTKASTTTSGTKNKKKKGKKNKKKTTKTSSGTGY